MNACRMLNSIKRVVSSPPGFLVGSVLLIILVVFFILLCVFTFWVPCCDVRCDFRIKTMFGSSLPPVVSRRAHVLFTLFVFACVRWCPRHIVLCFCFLCLCLVCHMLPVSLDCQFLIIPSVFSNVYLICVNVYDSLLCSIFSLLNYML